jgi:ethanolamine utilization cobalamin adenosyltransferase
MRLRSHRPQEFYGQPHFMPESGDSLCILRLNRLRCIARQAELAAAHAFADRDGVPTRTDIQQALNRMSSMLYLLMIRQKANC